MFGIYSFSSIHYFLFLMNKAEYSALDASRRRLSEGVADLRTDGRTDGRTGGPTDGRTDGRTLL